MFVYVWRHGRAAHFAGLDRLVEVSQRDVAPDVAAQVDADGVDAPLHVADLGHAVVRLDLGGVGIEVQVQRLDEAPRERGPVHVRVGRDVGVVVAHGAVDLAAERYRGQTLALALKARDDVGDFLADGGGRG